MGGILHLSQLFHHHYDGVLTLKKEKVYYEIPSEQLTGAYGVGKDFRRPSGLAFDGFTLAQVTQSSKTSEFGDACLPKRNCKAKDTSDSLCREDHKEGICGCLG